MAGAYETDLVSKRLDKADAIFRAYEDQTPFVSSLPKGKRLKDVMAMWTVDAQGNAYDPAVAEGTDATATPASVQPKALYARAQIWRSERWFVTRTAEAVEQTDVASEIAKQKARCLEKFMLSIESGLLSYQEAVATGTRKTRGLLRWAQNSAQAVDPVDEALRPTSSMLHTTALANLTVTVFQNMLEASRLQLRKKPTLVGKVGIKLKRHMTTWGKVVDIASNQAAVQHYNINAMEKRLISMIDFFEFDAGSVRTMVSDYLACDTTSLAETDFSPRTGIFYAPDRVRIRWLRPIEHYDQDDEGGGKRGYYEGEGALIVDSPQGFLTVYTDSDS